MISHVFSVYCKMMYLRVTTNCSFMSDVAVESGVQSLGTAASNRHNVRAPDDRRVWGIGRMAISKGNLSARWNIHPSATSLTKNPIWTVLELNWASAAKNLRLTEQSRHSRSYTKIGYLNIGLPTNATSIHCTATQFSTHVRRNNYFYVFRTAWRRQICVTCKV
jgi:hypothetical protein